MDKPRRTKRNQSYYRHQRKRVVKAKARKQVIRWNERDKKEFLENPKSVGRLHKGAAYCSCSMCRFEQRMGIPKAKVKATEDFYNKQIEQHLNGEDI